MLARHTRQYVVCHKCSCCTLLLRDSTESVALEDRSDSVEASPLLAAPYRARARIVGDTERHLRLRYVASALTVFCLRRGWL